jgi:hypothetical protein
MSDGFQLIWVKDDDSDRNFLYFSDESKIMIDCSKKLCYNLIIVIAYNKAKLNSINNITAFACRTKAGSQLALRIKIEVIIINTPEQSAARPQNSQKFWLAYQSTFHNPAASTTVPTIVWIGRGQPLSIGGRAKIKPAIMLQVTMVPMGNIRF